MRFKQKRTIIPVKRSKWISKRQIAESDSYDNSFKTDSKILNSPEDIFNHIINIKFLTYNEEKIPEIDFKNDKSSSLSLIDKTVTIRNDENNCDISLDESANITRKCINQNNNLILNNSNFYNLHYNQSHMENLNYNLLENILSTEKDNYNVTENCNDKNKIFEIYNHEEYDYKNNSYSNKLIYDSPISDNLLKNKNLQIRSNNHVLDEFLEENIFKSCNKNNYITNENKNIFQKIEAKNIQISTSDKNNILFYRNNPNITENKNNPYITNNSISNILTNISDNNAINKINFTNMITNNINFTNIIKNKNSFYILNKIKEETLFLLNFPLFDISTLQKLKFLEIIFLKISIFKKIKKRSIFYESPPLFKNQKRVDFLIKFFTNKFKCSQQELNILSGTKGIFYGNVVFEYYNKEISNPISINIKNNNNINYIKGFSNYQNENIHNYKVNQDYYNKKIDNLYDPIIDENKFLVNLENENYKTDIEGLFYNSNNLNHYNYKNKEKNRKNNFSDIKSKCLMNNQNNYYNNFRVRSAIPEMEDISFLKCYNKKVLVVEKETIFDKIVQEIGNLNLLIVCGKGYPCKNTLKFLKRLKMDIYILTDFDPFGLSIYCNYYDNLISKEIDNSKNKNTSEMENLQKSFFINNLHSPDFINFKNSSERINLENLIRLKLDSNRSISNSIVVKRIGIGYEDIFNNNINREDCIKLNKYDMRLLQSLKSREIVKSEAKFIEGIGLKMEMEIVFNQPSFDIIKFLKSKIDGL